MMSTLPVQTAASTDRQLPLPLTIVVVFPAEALHVRVILPTLHNGTNDSVDQLLQFGLLRHIQVLVQEWVQTLVLHVASLTDAGEGLGQLLTQSVLRRGGGENGVCWRRTGTECSEGEMEYPRFPNGEATPLIVVPKVPI